MNTGTAYIVFQVRDEGSLECAPSFKGDEGAANTMYVRVAPTPGFLVALLVPPSIRLRRLPRLGRKLSRRFLFRNTFLLHAVSPLRCRLYRIIQKGNSNQLTRNNQSKKRHPKR